MNLSGYYSTGQFARLAGVTLKTIRFYDKKNILKPSYVKPSGARFYTEEDLAKLQQILLLKYLGFTLEEIKELAIEATDSHLLINSLKLQKKLVKDQMEQLQLVKAAIDDTVVLMEQEQQMDWSNLLELIHLTGMEHSLKLQYQDAGNISARIRLHREFSVNPQGWFPWVFEQCNITEGMRILELGCGNGILWTENIERLPNGVHIVLSDISEGMIRDARRNLQEIFNEKQEFLSFQVQEGSNKAGENSGFTNSKSSCASLEEAAESSNMHFSEQLAGKFSYAVFDCHTIPYENNSFDFVIANHLLFYCEDIFQVCQEVKRVLKPGGRFVCSTYGSKHMKEITQLVQEFDSRIVLAAENLYEKFGIENGKALLEQFFGCESEKTDSNCPFTVSFMRYEDKIWLNQPEPLLEYILSCHGNQNQILLDKYKEFKRFVTEKVRHGFSITKDAGVFIVEYSKD